MESRHPALAAVVVALGLLLHPAAASRAQSVDGFQMPPASPEKAVPSSPVPRLRLEAALMQAPLHTLPPASVGAGDQLAALAAWNAAGKLPLKNGFARPLTSPAVVRLGGIASPPAAPRPYAGGLLAVASAGELAWGTRVTVQNAYRLRLQLSDVHLPPGTRMWVQALGGTPRQFGLELQSASGELWTPSVKGNSLLFEIHLPAGSAAASFAVREVMELFSLAPGTPGNPGTPAGASGTGVLTAPPGDPSCIVDSSCAAADALAGLDGYRHAMAQLTFAQSTGEYVCSGGLLNDTKGDGAAYLLTANHCFADDLGASSLEAAFDFYTTGCNATPPDESTVPTVNGAKLLATGTISDFTLVRLFSLPPGRFLLGWTADPSVLTQNTPLYRLSFPFPDSQIAPDPERYSQSLLKIGNNIPVCAPEKPRPQFIYGKLVKGGTFGGSSGAPLLLGNGQVVGQLGGGCAFVGHDPTNGCDYANSEFDGAFNVSFPSLAPWLNPAPVTSGPCVPSATTLCIDQNPGDKRFMIQASFATSQGGGQSGSGTAIPLSGEGVTQGGLFWFFQPTNPEMLIKVIDGCALNSSFWVFFAATTNVGFTVTVTDTVALTQEIYTNQDMQAAFPVQDTGALPCP